VLVAARARATTITVSATPDQAFDDGANTSFYLYVPVDSPVYDLNVAVHVEYPRPASQTACMATPPLSRIDDMTSTLVSPDGGIPVVLAAHEGGTAEILDVNSNDEAASSITAASALNCETVSGGYQPREPLSTFDGTQMQGTWRLRIENDFDGYGGTLKSWSL